MRVPRSADSAVSFLALTLVLAGCATAPAGAQEERPTPRPNVYEVSPEHLAALAAAADTSEAGTLEVSGSAVVSVPADRVRIRFAVETEASGAREASRTNAERMDAVMRALRATEVEGLEIETTGYRLNPRYARPAPDRGSTREIAGYTAVNHVEVTVPEVEATGRLIDAAVGAGANRVASLRFEASDTDEARLRALRQAVRTAREEAEVIASAMGVRLGRPLRVNGGAQTPRPPRPEVFEMRAVQADTPVEPGEQTVSASVTITYRLEPAGN